MISVQNYYNKMLDSLIHYLRTSCCLLTLLHKRKLISSSKERVHVCMHLHQLFLVLQVGVFVLGGDPHTQLHKYRYFCITVLLACTFVSFDQLDVTLNGCIHAYITLLGVVIYFYKNLIIIIICKLAELTCFFPNDYTTCCCVICIQQSCSNIQEKITHEIVKRLTFRTHCYYYIYIVYVQSDELREQEQKLECC